MMELCGLPGQRNLFHQIAFSFGVQPAHNPALAPDSLRDGAMKLYVQPLLNYVMRQLPDDPQKTTTAGAQTPIPAPSQIRSTPCWYKLAISVHSVMSVGGMSFVSTIPPKRDRIWLTGLRLPDVRLICPAGIGTVCKPVSEHP